MHNPERRHKERQNKENPRFNHQNDLTCISKKLTRESETFCPKRKAEDELTGFNEGRKA
jgi:hypothetical protein